MKFFSLLQKWVPILSSHLLKWLVGWILIWWGLWIMKQIENKKKIWKNIKKASFFLDFFLKFQNSKTCFWQMKFWFEVFFGSQMFAK
jgi:hypothetical protein